jgi:kynureninase
MLTDRAIELADALSLEVITPRDHADRGSQVTLRHMHAWEVMQALIADGVVGDVRAPDVLRFGVAPLYNTYDEVDEAFTRLRQILQAETWRAWLDEPRPTVT